MGVILDTSIWVDVERGRLAPADVAAVTGEEPVYLAPPSSPNCSTGGPERDGGPNEDGSLVTVERRWPVGPDIAAARPRPTRKTR